MTLEEAIKARHSVRNYKHQPLLEKVIGLLQQKIDECNASGNLHIQLVTNETKAFSGIMSYGVFSGVENYLIMAGRKAADLDERIGYTKMDLGIAKLHFEIGAGKVNFEWA